MADILLFSNTYIFNGVSKKLVGNKQDFELY